MLESSLFEHGKVLVQAAKRAKEESKNIIYRTVVGGEEFTVSIKPVVAPAPPASKYKFLPTDLEFAGQMLSDIRRLNPTYKQPNLDQWANEIRLMREVDNRPEQLIGAVWQWANGDDFWQTNILSPAKLRQKFDDLLVKARRQHGRGKQQGATSDDTAILAEAIRQGR
jgi:hypothetical protein